MQLHKCALQWKGMIVWFAYVCFFGDVALLIITLIVL